MQTGTLITWNPKNNDSFIGLRKKNNFLLGKYYTVS